MMIMAQSKIIKFVIYCLMDCIASEYKQRFRKKKKKIVKKEATFVKISTRNGNRKSQVTQQ